MLILWVLMGNLQPWSLHTATSWMCFPTSKMCGKQIHGLVLGLNIKYNINYI